MKREQHGGSDVHPLYALNMEIEQKGMMVIENVNTLPSYEDPFISPHLVIAISHEGISHGEYDMRPVVFHPHDFSVIYPNHLISAQDSSPDYRVTLLIISSQLYEHLQPSLAYSNTKFFYSQPVFHLTDEQYQCVCGVIQVMKSLGELNLTRGNEIIGSFIDILSLMVGEFRLLSFQAEPHAADNAGSSRTYFPSFYNLIVRHYRESRTVGFYANKLCLSPKYFGNIIKQETGVSAGEWIGRYVTTRAMLYLRHRADLTVQQIAHQLGFLDASSFARYFRTHTGITAMQYRRQCFEQRA